MIRALDSDTARAGVDTVLETFFIERIARAATFDTAYEALWRRMRDAIHGGKRVRPALVLMTHRLLGGRADDDALAAAAAVELLHTALLFHDDILDGDLIRRGKPNLQGTFVTDALEAGGDAPASRTWGTTAGLLGGDLLISAAHSFLARIRSDARSHVHEIFDDALMVTAAGEMADVGFSVATLHPTTSSITSMMTNKTAAYSFSAPLRIGAALAGADAETSAELAQIGAALGFIYQLRDDVLGVFGDATRLGKSTDADLREGKRTLLIAAAEGTTEWAQVRHLFGRRTMSTDDVSRLRGAIEASGARDEISGLIVHSGDQLQAMISRARLPEPLAAELSAITRHCAERDA